MATHPTRPRWFWTVLLVSFLSFPVLDLGAQSAQTAPTAVPSSDTLKVKVKVVTVTKSGTSVAANPSTIKLHQKQDIVVWVTNGSTMKIDWKPGNPAPGNPFTDLVCKGSFCGALVPPAALGTFKYKVTVDGVALDPNVEVIPKP